MKKLIFKLRNSLLPIVVLGALGFGGVQTFAGGPQIVDSQGRCGAWACRLECPDFGGALVPGGPGKPLKCACCG